MDNQVWSALIQAGGAVLAGGLGLLVRPFVDGLRVPSISRARRTAINGNWEGTIQSFEAIGDTQPTFTAPITLQLKTHRSGVTGKGGFVRDGREYKFTLSGRIYNDQFIVMYYEHEPPKLALGTMIVELRSDADWMSGKAVGHGGKEGKIYTGTIEVRKRPGNN